MVDKFSSLGPLKIVKLFNPQQAESMKMERILRECRPSNCRVNSLNLVQDFRKGSAISHLSLGFVRMERPVAMITPF